MPDKKKPALSYIRLLHAYPDTSFIDLYIEKKLLFKDLCYRDFSRYTAIPSGSYSFELRLHKQKESFYARKLSILPDTIYTLVFAPKHKEETSHLFLLEDKVRPTTSNHCFLRIADFYKPSSPLCVYLPEKPLIKTISYSEISSYTALEPHVYPFSFYKKEKYTVQNEPFYTSKPFLTKWGRFYTVYFIGSSTTNYPCESLFSIDGSSYLNQIKKRR